MKITFECSSNIASLMIAFYDIVSGVAPGDSITAQENFGWIIDELGSRVHEFIWNAEHSTGITIPVGMRGLSEIYPGYAPNNGVQPTTDTPQNS